MSKKAITKLMQSTQEQLITLVDDALSAQRTMIAGEPEKVIRLLALEQMAQHYDKEALGFYRAADVFEAQECECYAKKAREFADLIREGKHP